MTLDITDYYDQNVDLYLQVDDYALNARAYRINNFKSLADAVNYPESIEIVSGEDATGEGYSKAVTIGVNEAYKLETLIAPADATSVNLYWSSDDENVVRVKDGELFGVGPRHRAGARVRRQERICERIGRHSRDRFGRSQE